MGNKRREAVKRLSRLQIMNGPLASVVQPKLNTYFISHCPSLLKVNVKVILVYV